MQLLVSSPGAAREFPAELRKSRYSPGLKPPLCFLGLCLAVLQHHVVWMWHTMWCGVEMTRKLRVTCQCTGIRGQIYYLSSGEFLTWKTASWRCVQWPHHLTSCYKTSEKWEATKHLQQGCMQWDTFMCHHLCVMERIHKVQVQLPRSRGSSAQQCLAVLPSLEQTSWWAVGSDLLQSSTCKLYLPCVYRKERALIKLRSKITVIARPGASYLFTCIFRLNEGRILFLWTVCSHLELTLMNARPFPPLVCTIKLISSIVTSVFFSSSSRLEPFFF